MRELILSFLARPEQSRFYETVKTQIFLPPTSLFELKAGLHLAIGGERIEVFYPGHAHAPDNVAVYFAEPKILFGGCAVRPLAGQSLGNLSDASVKDWPAAAARLVDAFPESEIVIPGHGAWGDIGLLKHTQSLAEAAARE